MTLLVTLLCNHSIVLDIKIDKQEEELEKKAPEAKKYKEMSDSVYKVSNGLLIIYLTF